MTAILVAALIVATFGVWIFRYFYPASGHWRAGYNRYPTDAIITHRRSSIKIDAKYEATITKCSDLIFFDDPQQDDLVDLVDSLPNESISESRYRSDDSTIRDVRHATPHNLVVYWKPTKNISAFQPYTHCSTHVSPSKYGTDAFYHSTYYDRDVGVATYLIESSEPVEEAVAFVMPPLQSQVTVKRLYRYWSSGKRRGCEQPVIQTENKISWQLERPLKGRVYVIFVIYKGERQRFIHESRQLFLRYRAKEALALTLGRAKKLMRI